MADTDHADLDTVFFALSDATRRGILGMLARGDRTTGSLADEFPVSRPAVSKHLRVLYDANLVTRRRDGRNRVYGLSAEPLGEAHQWLGHYRRFWRESLAALRRHVEGTGPEDDEPGKTEGGGGS